MPCETCEICRRIELIRHGKNPYFVCELETGFVVLGDHQRFNGYTLFLCKQHVTELFHLENDFRLKFLDEMTTVCHAVNNVFGAQKMNVELLGNGDSHLHWHLFPRIDGDTPEKGPVWWLPKEEMWNDKFKPTTKELKEKCEKLKQEIFRLLQTNHQA